MSRPRSRLAPRDLLAEALAGLAQRPGRAAFTAVGTVLGVGAFVVVIGLTATAGGQISKRFTALAATEVTVEEADQATGIDGNPFPPDADARVAAIDGVVSGGVRWTVDDQGKRSVSGAPLPGSTARVPTPVLAASPGLLRALKPSLREGRLFDEGHEGRADRVVVLGSVAAESLGISTLAASPAIFIDGTPFTVVGILDGVSRRSDSLLSVLVPRRTAERQWGPPGSDQPVEMLIDTRLGAAPVTAAQVAVALRPDAPDVFLVKAPPEATVLREGVASDLQSLFLLLAGVCLAVGAVGIANTTMVAVLERVPEIGLRRALGARPRHLAAQFLVESAATGTVGGLVGTSAGVVAVVAVSLARGWTAVLDPTAVLAAPLIGTAVGVLAGLWPAMHAARIEPADALRR